MVKIQILVAGLVALSFTALAQNCGPNANNTVCNEGNCCSSAGWCGNSKDHCDATTCLPQFSDPISICATQGNETSGNEDSKKPSSTGRSALHMKMAQFGIGMNQNQVPDVDQCGLSIGITCPGAGKDGYFYRCCSSSGHCGPKNDIQDQAIYCGDGCQSGFGNCAANVAVPSRPATPPRIVTSGHKCGPIVNAKCAAGLCCSGSNFCGTGKDYCGAENWCQPEYGQCD